MSGVVHIARGARAAEAVMLEAIAEHAAAVRADPSQLAQPLSVVVPSKSLRAHLGAASLRRVGHSLAGVVVRTLHGLAQDLMARAGEPFPDGQSLVPVLARRRARTEKLLHEALEPLEDGYGAVAESVEDLIDAGLVVGSGAAEALEDALSEGPHSFGVAGERARAVVRVAAGVLADLDALGVAPRAALFSRARETLLAEPERMLPGPVWIHGYADATGVQADLLEGLVTAAGAHVVLDRPPDPALPEREDLGVRFAERLELRFAVAPRRLREEHSVPAARPRLVAAPGAQGEARAVAEAIRKRLDAGARPEGIGIVARQLEPYLAPLRGQLRRLGIPHSGAPGARGPLGPAGRRLGSLLDLLGRREQITTDRWLDARVSLDPGRRSELRLAFHTLGAARLVEVPELDLEARLGPAGDGGPGSGLRLPVRSGLRDVEGREQRESHRVPRRDLETALGRARELLDHLGRWRGPLPLMAHREKLAQLLELLGWSDLERPRGGVGPAAADIARAKQAAHLRETLEEVGAALPDDLELDFDELRLLVEDALERQGSLAPGGEGGGVALLSVTDARARTFEELFVLGVNRDRFPRVVTEDALLPDGARRQLEAVLPDVPLKLRGHDEERYLFAQLVSSSPRVTLLWQAVDDDGRERNPSPAIERLRLAPGAEPVESARGPLAEGSESPATAAEQALRAGLAGVRKLEPLLAHALEEARGDLGLEALGSGYEVLARARLDVLREFERAPGGDLGPYFGFLGARPPGELLYVTFYESVVFCPWKTFLGRRLGLESVPDALAELPEATRRLRGTLIHATLEAIARRAGVPGGTPLAQLGERHTVPWPEADELDALLGEESARLARDEGIGLSNFSRLLAESVRPVLEEIRATDWPGGSCEDVLGVETQGTVELALADGSVTVGFKADRIDAGGADPAQRVLTDYKAGSRPSGSSKPETRQREFLRQIRQGRRLQGHVYAAAGGAGRYLFADPDARGGGSSQVYRIDATDGAAEQAFTSAFSVLRRAWLEGALPPRLLSDDRRGPYRFCADCEVAEACLQGDSGAGRRLRAWLEAPVPGEGPAEEAARGLAELPTAKPAELESPAGEVA